MFQERANAPAADSLMKGPRERKKVSYGEELSERDWGVSLSDLSLSYLSPSYLSLKWSGNAHAG